MHPPVTHRLSGKAFLLQGRGCNTTPVDNTSQHNTQRLNFLYEMYDLDPNESLNLKCMMVNTNLISIFIG